MTGPIASSLNDLARIVVEPVTLIGELYRVELSLGIDPSVVYLIANPTSDLSCREKFEINVPLSLEKVTSGPRF